MLHTFISENRDAILDIASAKIAARDAPRATETALGEGISQFLDELIETLKFPPSQAPSSHPRMEQDSTLHGRVLLRRGFTVAQVIHDYGALCQSITSLAFARDAWIGADEFQVLNSCLDDALAGAVTAYLEAREQTMQEESTVRLGVLAHEFRNHLNGATLAFDIIRTGSVGVGGQTSAVLDRSLRSLRNLVDRSLAEVRLATDVIESRELISLPTFIEEIELVAAMEARQLDLRFHLARVPSDAFLYADKQLLASAVSNLLQNACKFTRPDGQVTLQVRVTGDRVLIEVRDECGGLPAGFEAQAVRPFTQAHPNRTGLGLGLVIVRRAVARDGGELRVQDLPGEGCIFTVDMPLAARTASGDPADQSAGSSPSTPGGGGADPLERRLRRRKRVRRGWGRGMLRTEAAHGSGPRSPGPDRIRIGGAARGGGGRRRQARSSRSAARNHRPHRLVGRSGDHAHARHAGAYIAMISWLRRRGRSAVSR